uniref:DUF8204 domain-containing protein n=1 Tax=Davidia involucrata TaxID=16924 RepID=A0A5B6ZZU9_DAVIN
MGEEVKGGDEESPNNNQNQVTGSKKGKSCKGCLYYSSTLKSNSRNPLCVGISRTLPQVPRYIVGESEVEASKEGRSLTDFKYACVGYSVYPDGKDPSTDRETQTELPVCVGIEVLVDKRVGTADSIPAHVHNREDGHGFPQPGLVAMGVAKNMRKVGNHMKDTLEDILYPYRRRPK